MVSMLADGVEGKMRLTVEPKETEEENEGAKGHKWHRVSVDLALVLDALKGRDAVEVKLLHATWSNHPRADERCGTTRAVDDACGMVGEVVVVSGGGGGGGGPFVRVYACVYVSL